MIIALLNQSRATVADMDHIAGMLKANLAHVTAAWSLAPVEIQFHMDTKVAPDGQVPLVAFDHADLAGALGYHDLDPYGRAYGRAFLDVVPGHCVLHDVSLGGASLAGVLSHEACELVGNEQANEYRDGPFIAADGHSWKMVAAELCDPVQELSYAVTLDDGTAVDASDFVLPQWFNAKAQHVGSFDFLGVLHAPLTLAPGGYVIVRDTGLRDDQVFGRSMLVAPVKVSHAQAPAAWRDKAKALPGSRTHKRLHGLGGAC